ncbi:MAG TPA: hypothetical protein PLP05_00835 [Sedimentisphaerales bacterium]|nr:hypothetical protein [Sedimentisphaerales bacterium]
MRKLIILFLILVSSASSFASDNAVKIKMLHVFIKADANEVRFENLWVYRRDKAGSDWKVDIEIPETAYLQDSKNDNSEQNNHIVSKSLNADSLIDSVNFTYYIANDNGRCLVSFKADYDIDSMTVYVSGPETALKCDLLKFNPYLTMRSRYSGVYTAENIRARQLLDIELSALPADEDMLIEYISVFSLALIVLTALLTLIVCKLKMNNLKSNK